MTRKLKQALHRQKKNTKQEVLQITGILGIPLGGSRLVEVPGRNAYVYVRLRNNQNEVIQAFNNQVAPSYNLPVVVERRGNRYSVVEVDDKRYENNWPTFAPFLPRHGNTHSFDLEGGGGGDIVWVYSRQMMPILVMPSGTLGAPNVVVSSYTLRKENGNWIYVGNTGTQNFTPYLPSTGAVMGLVYLDATDGNPYFIINSGTYFSSTLTGTNQIAQYIPSIPSPATQIPLAAIRLVTGTSQISWDNIYDVRQWLHTVPTGTGGGGGAVITGTSIQDEGIPLGVVGTLNFVGGGVDVSVSGTTARVHITGSTGGGVSNLTGTSIGLPNKVALTNNSGFLNTHPGLAWGLQGSNPFVEFGANIPGKVFNAGYMGYNLFSTGYLEVIGAGTGSGDRWVRIYDNLKVNTHLQTSGFQHLGLLNAWIYLNATGTADFATSAPELIIVTGSDSILGLKSSDGSNQSVRFSVNDLAEGIVYADTIGTFTGGATVQPTGTYSTCPWKDTVNSTANNLPWPDGGLVSNLNVRISTSQPASGSLVVTFMVEGVATPLAVTIPAGSGLGTYSNTTNQVPITDNQNIRWNVQNNATTTSAAITGVTMKLNKRTTS